MIDPLKAFMQATALETPAFPQDSRYHGLPLAHWQRPDGTQVPYVTRRFLPAPETLATLLEVRVAQGDRLDNLAARHLGDPQQYWRICDGNRTLRRKRSPARWARASASRWRRAWQAPRAWRRAEAAMTSAVHLSRA